MVVMFVLSETRLHVRNTESPLLIPETLLCLLFVSAAFWGCTDDEPGPDHEPDVVEENPLTDAGLDPTHAADADNDRLDDAILDIEDIEEDGGTDPGDHLPPEPWDVTERGPYNVSYIRDRLTYTPRGEGEEPRTLDLAIWYPTLAQSGAKARYLGVWNRAPVFANSEPAHDRPMPVLVFSHGNSSIAEQSFFMTEFFASHGWLVIAPSHKNNTVFDNLGAINVASGVHRPQDISATIDFLESLPQGHRVYGLPSEDIVLSGHSFGGYTTLANSGATFDVDTLLAQCASGEISSRNCSVFGSAQLDVFREGFLDSRVKVSIPKTPAGAQLFSLAPIAIPTLLWTGGLDATLPNEEEGDPIWEGLVGSQHRRIDLTTAGHFTFSNMCELFGAAVPEVADDGCDENFIPYEEAFPIINAYSLAFARHHLFGDDTHLDLLDGSRLLTEAMVISRKQDE